MRTEDERAVPLLNPEANAVALFDEAVARGHLAIRPCFINPHTRLADVDALIDHVIAIGDELTGGQPG